MPIAPIVEDLTPIEVAIENIFLDPNNPRFVGTGSVYVSEAEISKKEVQEEVQRLLVRDYAIDKLRANMEVNGYLPIDRIVVREFVPGKYVVLEGNRRICAAKMISAVGLDGSNIDPKVLASIKTIPCLQYTGVEKDAAWIFQGLRHITGVIEWSSYNKARLLVEQMEEEGLSLTDTGKRFGLTPHGAGQWVRGYYAFKQARENSDFINEVDERSYLFFNELFSRSSAAVRDWMEWDDTEKKFNNALNFNEFVGWLYPRDESEEETTDSKGDWSKRWLARRDDLRQVSYLISDAPDTFLQFRKGGEIEKCYSLALARKYEAEAKEKSDPVKDVFDSIKSCTKALEEIPYKVLKNAETKAKLETALAELKAAIAAINQ